MRIGTASVLLALFAAVPAQAAVMVIGSTIGHACYAAAERPFGAANGEQTCTLALNDGAISLRDRAATYINRGVIRISMQQYDGALRDFERAIAEGEHLSAPDLGVAYVDRAAVLNSLKRYQEARDSASKGIDLGTSRPEIGYYERAIAAESLGDFKAAYYDYKQAVAIGPGLTLASEQLKRFRVVPKPANGS